MGQQRTGKLKEKHREQRRGAAQKGDGSKTDEPPCLQRHHAERTAFPASAGRANRTGHHTLNASPKLRAMMMPPTKRPTARRRLCRIVCRGELGCLCLASHPPARAPAHTHTLSPLLSNTHQVGRPLGRVGRLRPPPPLDLLHRRQRRGGRARAGGEHGVFECWRDARGVRACGRVCAQATKKRRKCVNRRTIFGTLVFLFRSRPPFHDLRAGRWRDHIAPPCVPGLPRSGHAGQRKHVFCFERHRSPIKQSAGNAPHASRF